MNKEIIDIGLIGDNGEIRENEGKEGLNYPQIVPDNKAVSTQVLNLRLGNLKNTRQSLSRIIKLYGAGELKAEKYRNLCYGLNSLIVAFKTEIEIMEVLEIKKDIEDIKQGGRDYGFTED